MGRFFGAAAIAVGLAVGFAGAPAGAGEGPGLTAAGVPSRASVPSRAAVPGASRPRPVALINGDRLLAGAGPGGAISHELMAGTARGINAQLVTMALGGTTYVVPADAVPYLGRGLSPGLGLDGSTTAGRQVLHVAAGHLPLGKAAAVMSAAVSVSFNGGKTWHPATVTGHDGSYAATFTAPAGAKVSLRTSASDAAGGSISETITNAYQISP